jgi:hypothetical protein
MRFEAYSLLLAALGRVNLDRNGLSLSSGSEDFSVELELESLLCENLLERFTVPVRDNFT